VSNIRRAFALDIRKSMALLAVLGAIAGIVLILQSVASVRGSILAERKVMLRNEVDTALSTLREYHAQAQSGALSQKQAQAQALAALQSMRFGAHGYFIVTTDTYPVPTMVMHATVPKLDGKLLDAAKNDNATAWQEVGGPLHKTDGHLNHYSAFVLAARGAGGGFVQYPFPKPRAGGGVTRAAYPKLTYAHAFAPWHLVVSTGPTSTTSTLWPGVGLSRCSPRSAASVLFCCLLPSASCVAPVVPSSGACACSSGLKPAISRPISAPRLRTRSATSCAPPRR
jgi:methyl-accepting chemotaxis protein